MPAPPASPAISPAVICPETRGGRRTRSKRAHQPAPVACDQKPTARGVKRRAVIPATIFENPIHVAALRPRAIGSTYDITTSGHSEGLHVARGISSSAREPTRRHEMLHVQVDVRCRSVQYI